MRMLDVVKHLSDKSLMEFQVQIFGHISFFLSHRQLQVVLDGKCSEEYPIHAAVSQGRTSALYGSNSARGKL